MSALDEMQPRYGGRHITVTVVVNTQRPFEEIATLVKESVLRPGDGVLVVTEAFEAGPEATANWKAMMEFVDELIR